MTTPYAPPPEKHPERVPENRVVANKKALWLWLFIIVVFVAFYQVFQPDGPARPAQPRIDGPPLALWPLLIPLATIAALAAAFWRMRSRLPAKYRTGELRTLKREVPKPPETAPASARPVELRGFTATSRVPVNLLIDDAGLHWKSDARLLNPAQWLDVSWSELQGFSVAPHVSPWRNIGIWAALVVIFIGVSFVRGGHPNWMFFGETATVAFILVVVSFVTTRRVSGSLTFTTPTHHLQLTSRDLTPESRERLALATKARRPDLFPATQTKKTNAWYVLFIQPYALLGKVFQSDAAVRADAATGTAQVGTDEEGLAAGAIQIKLHALWSGGLMALLPCSMGLAGALMTGVPYHFATGYFFAWALGLILSARLLKTLARLSGMSLIQ